MTPTIIANHTKASNEVQQSIGTGGVILIVILLVNLICFLEIYAWKRRNRKISTQVGDGTVLDVVHERNLEIRRNSLDTDTFQEERPSCTPIAEGSTSPAGIVCQNNKLTATLYPHETIIEVDEDSTKSSQDEYVDDVPLDSSSSSSNDDLGHENGILQDETKSLSEITHREELLQMELDHDRKNKGYIDFDDQGNEYATGLSDSNDSEVPTSSLPSGAVVSAFHGAGDMEGRFVGAPAVNSKLGETTAPQMIESKMDNNKPLLSPSINQPEMNKEDIYVDDLSMGSAASSVDENVTPFTFHGIENTSKLNETTSSPVDNRPSAFRSVGWIAESEYVPDDLTMTSSTVSHVKEKEMVTNDAQTGELHRPASHGQGPTRFPERVSGWQSEFHEQEYVADDLSLESSEIEIERTTETLESKSGGVALPSNTSTYQSAWHRDLVISEYVEDIEEIELED